jgi:hypothetical protein
MLRSIQLGEVGIAGVVGGSHKCIREPDTPVELADESLESWPGDGSITRGVPKQSWTRGQVGGILISYLCRGGYLEAQQVRRSGWRTTLGPVSQSDRRPSAGVFGPRDAANE